MKKLKHAYSLQKGKAKDRGIDWCFTFETWLDWWQKTGKLDRRGRTKESPYQMCRYEDKGPYHPDNVYCGTIADNINDTFKYGNAVGWKLTEEQRSEIGRRGGIASAAKNKELLTLDDDIVSKRLDEISGIDLTKYGWVSKVSNVLGLSHTQARRFVDKFYTGDVYKRN